MHPTIRDILDLPQHEQLDHALDVLRTLLEGRVSHVERYQLRFGLTLTQARMLDYLVQNAGRSLSKDDLLIRLRGFDTDTKLGTMDAHLFNLRMKTRGTVVIQAVRPGGLMISKETACQLNSTN